MVAVDDIARMRAQLFFEGQDVGRRMTRYCLLLVLAAIIASAGVAGDSTATVIGAMIVAPLMSPILGLALAIVLNDRRNLLRCIATVVASICAVIVLSFLLGLLVVEPVTAATNTQAAARVSPKLLDLLAALATGVVGSVALVRSDISDTLPGVAIAISLVPPLAVVGLTLEAGRPDEALGALLLFLANVSAIMVTGVVTMAMYGMLLTLPSDSARRRRWRRPGVVIVLALVLVVAAPLAATSIGVARVTTQQFEISKVITPWAESQGWSLISITPRPSGFAVRLVGPTPAPDTERLRTSIREAGLENVPILIELIPETRVNLGPGS